MTQPITFLLKSTIFPGKAAELRELLEKVIAHCTATEPGMRVYDWYINAAEDECVVIETYADSDALLFHLQNYAEFRPAMAECRAIKEANLLGQPSAKLVEALAGLGPGIYTDYVSLPSKE